MLDYTQAVVCFLVVINCEMDLAMSEKKVTKVSLTQIEDALEERQKPDRRERHLGIPQDVPQERRKTDRRESKSPHK